MKISSVLLIHKNAQNSNKNRLFLRLTNFIIVYIVVKIVVLKITI